MMTIILSALAVLLVGSLIFSAILHARQKAALERQNQIKKHQSKADEFQSYITVLQKYDPQNELLHIVTTQMRFHLVQAAALDPANHTNAQRLSQVDALQQQLKNNERNQALKKAVESESEMSSVFFQFMQLGKLLEILGNGGKLPRATVVSLNEYLTTLKVEIEVNSHIYQAELQAAKNESILYQAHLKQALEIVKKSSIDTELKNERIREISERIAKAKATNEMVIDTIDTGRKVGNPEEE